jgi:outer membrane protein OmpA-like peptidoglycan-associated protein
MNRFLLFVLMSMFCMLSMAADISLDGQKSSFVTGMPVKLIYRGGNELQSDAWVGVYKKGFQSNREHLTYQYLDGDTGTLEFTAPKESGHYQFVLYSAGYESKEYSRVDFQVSAIDTDSITVATDHAVYHPAAPMEVTFKIKTKLSNKAWIGIFSQSAPRDDANTSLDYQYVEEKKQAALFFTAPATPGKYEVRLFDNEYGNEIVSVPFEVTDYKDLNTSLSTKKNNYAPDEVINVHFVSDKRFPEDAWVGIFSGHSSDKEVTADHYLSFIYLMKQVESDLMFKAPTVKGAYHFKMVSSDNGSVVAVADFRVDRSMDVEYLKEAMDKTGRISLYGIYFDVASSEIKRASEPTLQLVAELLKADPDLSLTIEGHTDSQGEAAYNKQLSEERAAAVKRNLVEKLSISDKRLKSIGYGEEKPVGDNLSESARALNRRVEIVKSDH